jgi:anti-sigma regulatory factor (Ser/Thr protein kinase)
MTLVDHHREHGSFHHDAFVYDSDDQYLRVLAPMIASAHAAGDTVLAVVPRRAAAMLRSAVDAGSTTTFVDAETWYRHPIATIADYDAVLGDLAAGTRAFVIGEVEFGSSEVEWAAWTRYEAALNRALEGRNARVVCPYDARVLPASVVDAARRTHPSLVTGSDGAKPSADYVEPGALLPRLPATVTVPVAPPDVDVVVQGDLRGARRAFAAAAERRGVAAVRLEDLTLALNEVLTNALVHGGGWARLRVWSTAPEDLTCLVEDGGNGVHDPLVGYAGPPIGATGGYGTWLARRLFDRSEFQAAPGGGLAVLLAARV